MITGGLQGQNTPYGRYTRPWEEYTRGRANASFR